MGAGMPDAKLLAPVMRSIVNLNAPSVRTGHDFHPDMEHVAKAIDRYLVQEN
jgi:hypothetical protein